MPWWSLLFILGKLCWRWVDKKIDTNECRWIITHRELFIQSIKFLSQKWETISFSRSWRKRQSSRGIVLTRSIRDQRKFWAIAHCNSPHSRAESYCLRPLWPRWIRCSPKWQWLLHVYLSFGYWGIYCARNIPIQYISTHFRRHWHQHGRNIGNVFGFE